MSTTDKYLIVGSTTTLISTELNSLANGSLAVSSSAFDNTVNATGDGSTLGDLQITLAALGGAATANSSISVYFLISQDGSTYEDGGSGTQPQKLPDLVYPLRAVSTA